MQLGDLVAKELSERLEVPTAIAAEIVADMRLMNEDIDFAFDDEEGESTVELARKLCERITANQQLWRWLERRAKIARESLEVPPS